MTPISSNTTMNEVNMLLENIHPVEPSHSLYTKTLTKIQEHKKVPVYWVKIAACLFILLFAAEFYVGTAQKEKKSPEITAFVSITKNNLYDE